MSLGKRLISTGGVAVCTTDTADVFGDSSGVALYTMDYDASEASGYYDGTATDVTFGVGGQINYGARFNGSSSLISIGSPIPNTDTNVAISAWVKLNSGISSNMHITGTGITSAGSEAPFRATLQYQSANTFRIFALRQVAGTYYLADNSTLTDVTINADTWYHIVWSYNSTGRKLSTFLNGTAIDTDVSMSTSGGSVNDSSTVIGSFRSTSGPFFDGTIDQLRIFSSTIDSTQASTLHAETACVYTATTTDNDYPTTNLAYYKLDNSAEDEKGSYDGTETNIEYRFGRYGQAAVFNGSSSKIDLGGSIISVGSFTVSLWLNANNVTTAGRAFHLGQGDNVSNISIFVASGNLTLRFLDSGSNLRDASITASTNTWYHAVITFDSSTNILKSYVNGTEELSVTTSGFSTLGNYGLIGARAYNNDQFFNGKIDQVRIYSTALSASQVTELYNEKPETDTSTFKTVLYTGDGGTQYISNVGFEPDLVWIKSRSDSDHHVLLDSIRGGTNPLVSSGTAAEIPDTDYVQSFDANGFTIKFDSQRLDFSHNENGDPLVAWVWKGSNADAVSNTDGTATTSVSANDKGFSIVKWTSNGTTQTMGHGLNIDGTATTPELIITKATNVSRSWYVWVDGFTTGEFLSLNSTAAKSSVSNIWGSLPTSTVFSYDSSQINNNDQVVAYCFASVSGYSKIGSYTGNETGQTIYTTDDGTSSGSNGFEPRFLMIKRTTADADWLIFDNLRTGTDQPFLLANSSAAESTAGSNDINLISNGFELQEGGGGTNNLDDGYIYMAFA